jgi:hypothetical protein
VRRGSYPLRPSPMPEDVLQGLGAATTVSSAGGGGGAALTMPAPNTSAKPHASRPREQAVAPQQVIDQPLLKPGQKGIAPPPPPAPPPAH